MRGSASGLVPARGMRPLQPACPPRSHASQPLPSHGAPHSHRPLYSHQPHTPLRPNPHVAPLQIRACAAALHLHRLRHAARLPAQHPAGKELEGPLCCCDRQVQEWVVVCSGCVLCCLQTQLASSVKPPTLPLWSIAVPAGVAPAIIGALILVALMVQGGRQVSLAARIHAPGTFKLSEQSCSGLLAIALGGVGR